MHDFCILHYKKHLSLFEIMVKTKWDYPNKNKINKKNDLPVFLSSCWQVMILNKKFEITGGEIIFRLQVSGLIIVNLYQKVEVNVVCQEQGSKK